MQEPIPGDMWHGYRASEDEHPFVFGPEDPVKDAVLKANPLGGWIEHIKSGRRFAWNYTRKEWMEF